MQTSILTQMPLKDQKIDRLQVQRVHLKRYLANNGDLPQEHLDRVLDSLNSTKKELERLISI